MKFVPLDLQGAYLIETERMSDDRGSFERTYCEAAFAEAGLATQFPQHNLSFNAVRGTVRGMHYQTAPHEEVKVVRCLHGAVDDVIVDIRPQSPTYRRIARMELSRGNGQALYISQGFAHGFQSLEDETLLHYMTGTPYHPECDAGFCWNDPAFDISWPLPITSISEKDRTFPAYPG